MPWCPNPNQSLQSLQCFSDVPSRSKPDANARTVVKKCWLWAWRSWIHMVTFRLRLQYLHGLGRTPGTRWNCWHYKILQDTSRWNCWQLHCTGLLAKGCPAICREFHSFQLHFSSRQEDEPNDERAWLYDYTTSCRTTSPSWSECFPLGNLWLETLWHSIKHSATMFSLMEIKYIARQGFCLVSCRKQLARHGKWPRKMQSVSHQDVFVEILQIGMCFQQKGLRKEGWASGSLATPLTLRLTRT